MRKIFYLPFTFLLAYSCTSESNKAPKIDYNDTSQADTLTIESLSADTTKMLIAQFPIYFDSTNVLIQPSGFVNVADIKRSRFDLDKMASSISKRGYSEDDAFSARVADDHISGNITNLYFDDLTSNTQRLLTTQVVKIERVSFLRQIAKKTNKHYLLYSVYDRDTNRDGKLDGRDISSLYISLLDGSGFKKLTDDKHEYSGGVQVNLAKRYYFTTIEDVNKDGFFDKGDKRHYYYIDFSGESYNVIEYNPLNTK